jgi:hypothetical protein
LGGHALINDPYFKRICYDVLNIDTAKVTRGGRSLVPKKIDEVMQKVCAESKGKE